MILKNLYLYLYIAFIIFIGGLITILLIKNIICWLIALELLFLSSFLNFIIFSLYLMNLTGYIYALLILIIAAVESALGLTLIILNYNIIRNVEKKNLKNLI